jgi:hypothetical protein
MILLTVILLLDVLCQPGNRPLSPRTPLVVEHTWVAAPSRALAAILRKPYRQCNEHARRSAAPAFSSARPYDMPLPYAEYTRVSPSVKAGTEAAGLPRWVDLPGAPLEQIAALQ